ncbi:hypothetical protein R1T08_06615 [Streptomyces sp. SBC-4]|nr:hypothetical protein [Streptomyces sp. SBC-4]MDV5143949.1 hypothetical protein [Streptomyces sp. SBC-4]
MSTMGKVKAAFTRIRGLKKESDGIALQNPALRAEGRRLQEQSDAGATSARHKKRKEKDR